MEIIMLLDIVSIIGIIVSLFFLFKFLNKSNFKENLVYFLFASTFSIPIISKLWSTQNLFLIYCILIALLILSIILIEIKNSKWIIYILFTVWAISLYFQFANIYYWNLVLLVKFIIGLLAITLLLNKKQGGFSVRWVLLFLINVLMDLVDTYNW